MIRRSVRDPSVDRRGLNTVYDAYGIRANLAVFKAIVHFLQRGSLEDPNSILECNAVQGNIPAIFLRIPTCSSSLVFTLCTYTIGFASAFFVTQLTYGSGPC